MTTYYHGTHHSDLPIHAGLCLTTSKSAAADYGDTIHAVDVDTASLVMERLYFDRDQMRQMWADNAWPCDTDAEITEYVARGIDAILFDDATESGTEHKTLRLLSDKALAAVAVAA